MIRRSGTLLLTLVALAVILSSVSFAAAQPALTRHTRDAVVHGQAALVGRLPGSQTMELSLVLPLRNETSLRLFLQDLYNPSSSNYRHFLNVENFTTMFGPTQRDYDAVVRWAKQNGFQVGEAARNRMVVPITGSADNVEKAFHVTLNIYQHPTENRTFFAPDREPSTNLPLQLFRINGLDSFSIAKPLVVRRDPSDPGVHSNATTGSCPQNSFCGSDMRAAYYGGGSLTGTGQTLGLFEFTGTDLDDVDTYYKNAGQTNNVPIILKGVNGASTTCLIRQGCDDTEATLDITQALGMAPGLDALTVYVGKTSPTLDDPGILNAMATASPLDAQLSCSWSWTRSVCRRSLLHGVRRPGSELLRRRRRQRQVEQAADLRMAGR
ncbi:MAG: hypothetical protein H0X25_00635 [Acidobacteriales bacterium]|nr:hypothetical protein [Terriglobales bacterium]